MSMPANEHVRSDTLPPFPLSPLLNPCRRPPTPTFPLLFTADVCEEATYSPADWARSAARLIDDILPASEDGVWAWAYLWVWM